MKYMSAVMVLAASVAKSFADTYDVDAVHSTIGFSVKHMVVVSVKGGFDAYTASFEVDPAALTTLKATAKIKTASINTKNAKRDEHLQSAEFFDAAKFPEITFASTSVSKAADGYLLKGNLTMRGVTKEIVIPVVISGPVKNPWGKTVMGIEGSVTINRKDWGINYGAVLDNGGLAVGDDVKIELSLEGVKRE